MTNDENELVITDHGHGKHKRNGDGMFMQVVKRLLHNRVSLIGLIILVILLILTIGAPLFAPYDPTYMDFAATYCTPCAEHIMGCDALGRDMFSRILYAGRYSLFLGFSASIMAAVAGVFFGALIGYAGGRVDMIVMRVCDIIAAIPGSLLAILISTALGTGYVQTIFALAIGGIPGGIRGTRAMALKERSMEYLESAKSINCSTFKVIFKHMVPNILAPTIVGTTMGIGNTIMSAATLSYIGLGIQPPTPEWGAMLSEGRAFVMTYPHMLLFPGLAIAVTVLCINMFGDGLRDALDPRLKD